MRRAIVKWGKLRIELPSKLLLFVPFKTYPALHNGNVSIDRNTRGWFARSTVLLPNTNLPNGSA